MRAIGKIELAVIVIGTIDWLIVTFVIAKLHPGLRWLWPFSLGDEPLLQACSVIWWLSLAAVAYVLIRRRTPGAR